MIVLDASAAVDLLTWREPAAWVESRLADIEMAVPELFDVEVLSGLRRLSLTGQTEPELADEVARLLPELPVVRFPHGPLVGRAWQLRRHINPYDAAYVALAEQLDAELITTDRRLARTHGHQARITAFPG